MTLTSMLDSAEFQNQLTTELEYFGPGDSPSWVLFSCWKENALFHGGGSPVPGIPHSQRQYDGDNHFEFCEVWSG